MEPVSDDDVLLAYHKLKRTVYYDRYDLSIRCRLAQFEISAGFDRRISRVAAVLNDNDPLNNKYFVKWLNQVTYRVVPKSLVKRPGSQNEPGRFITNVTSAKTYSVKSVNYFFDGPIELQLISVLWMMREGYLLDAALGSECRGSRLESRVGHPGDTSHGLYKKYHELYAEWRDTGIRKAKQLLSEDKTSVYIVGLDIKEYYYRIELDYDSLAAFIESARTDGAVTDHMPTGLLSCLRAICLRYREEIDEIISVTHDADLPETGCIPIGLCSSPLIANWYLSGFDQNVKDWLRPAYYGRYVDDMLMVVSASDYPRSDSDIVATVLDALLVKTGLVRQATEPSSREVLHTDLERDRNEVEYEIVGRPGLRLTQGKCILQYFDAAHSIAGLDKFKKKLEENGSNFLLLPVDEADHSLEEVAYDLMYEGSVNKFRSVTGLTENRYELAKHLARQTILHLLTDDPAHRKISIGLQKFFKGWNAIEFHDLWERVLTYFVVARDAKSATEFSKHIGAQIKRVQFRENAGAETSVTSSLFLALQAHYANCRLMADALAGSVEDPDDQAKSELATSIREANLVRHHFVRCPLLNYTDFQGSLLSDGGVEEVVSIDDHKVEFSPRFVYFDECALLASSRMVDIGEKTSFDWASELYTALNRHPVQDIDVSTVRD